MSKNDCEECNKTLVFIIVVALALILIFGLYFAVCYIDYKERKGATDVCVQVHKEGYEVLGNYQTADIYGNLKFYNVVKYKDGCINEIEVPAAEYFEEVNNE